MKKISESEFKNIVETSDVIEADHTGEKVLRMKNGNYLKLFMRKRFFSSSLIYPYWLRFVQNISALQKANIRTIPEVVEIFKVPHLRKTGVVCATLPGETIKQMKENCSINEELMSQLGAFIAMLHRKGVYFSALHLGNILMITEYEFGLIDICDLRIVHFHIPLFALKTNMRYLLKSRQGILKTISEKSLINAFTESYLDEIKPRYRKKMSLFIKELVDSNLNTL